jgi:hypothetical protein
MTCKKTNFLILFLLSYATLIITAKTQQEQLQEIIKAKQMAYNNHPEKHLQFGARVELNYLERLSTCITNSNCSLGTCLEQLTKNENQKLDTAFQEWGKDGGLGWAITKCSIKKGLYQLNETVSPLLK